MYNTLDLHWGLCTSQQHKFPQAQHSQCKSWMLSQSFRLPELMLHNTVWILTCPLGWEVNGQEWVIAAWIIHSTHKQPQLSPSNNSCSDKEGTWIHKLNYAGGDNPCAGTAFPEEKYRVTEGEQGKLQQLAGWYLQTQGLHWRSLWVRPHGFQQQNSPNLVYIGLSIGIESMFWYEKSFQAEALQCFSW